MLSPPPFAAMNPERLRLETVDTALRKWARRLPAGEEVYSVFIDADTLHRAEYDRAFPHLLMCAAAGSVPEASAAGAGQSPQHYLSPALCYHTYAALEGKVLHQGATVTARG